MLLLFVVFIIINYYIIVIDTINIYIFFTLRFPADGSAAYDSEESDELFDETEQLLQSVASELRSYESFQEDVDDDEDEFFVYGENLSRGQGLLSYYNSVSGESN